MDWRGAESSPPPNYGLGHMCRPPSPVPPRGNKRNPVPFMGKCVEGEKRYEGWTLGSQEPSTENSMLKQKWVKSQGEPQTLSLRLQGKLCCLKIQIMKSYAPT